MEISTIAILFIDFVLGVLKFAFVFAFLFLPLVVLFRLFLPSKWL